MVKAEFSPDSEVFEVFNERITEYYKNPTISGHMLFTPTDCLSAIAAAMYLIRDEGPEVQLASDDLEIDIPLTADEQALVDIVNSQHSTEDSGNLSFTASEQHHNPGACSDAEVNFGMVLQVNRGEAKHKTGKTIVYRDVEGKPILIQKTAGEHTTLGLEPIDIDGITYPAGTIYSAYSDLGKKYHKKDSSEFFGALSQKSKTVNLRTADINSIAPIRLSLWALPLDERAIAIRAAHYQPMGKSDEDLVRLIKTSQLSDFHEAFARR